MTPDVVAVLLVATLAAIGSTLALLVTHVRSGEEWEEVLADPVADDPEQDYLDWEWRLRIASLPEAYWY